jgi:predicted AAA+ superfamily ATPase
MGNKVADSLRRILLEWQEFRIPESSPRDVDLAALVAHPITAVIGPRRAGKTWLCFQAMRALLERNVSRKSMLYISLEDERLHPLSGEELTLLLDVQRELFGMPESGELYCFVDEIQNAPNWSKWVRRVTDQNPRLRLIVTGSSAKLLGTEIATELRGRARTVRLLPYSWKEFLIAQGWEMQGMDTIRFSPRLPDLRRLYLDYQDLGGFPGIRRTLNPRETLQEYYRAMFARDMIERFRIKNVPLFEDFLKLQVSRFSSLSSVSNLERELKSIGHRGSKKTLLSYLNYAREILLLFEVHLFSPKVKNQLLYSRKIYGIDQGLLNAIRFTATEDKGRILENMVFLELLRRGYEVYYFSNGAECDFVIREGNSTRLLVQVCYRMDSAKTREREIRGLRQAMETLRCAEGLILTDDDFEEVNIGEAAIRVRPFWHWALGLRSR